MPLAESELKNAEREFASAQAEQNATETVRIATLRVADAGEMDRHATAYAEAFKRYADRGEELIALRTGHGMLTGWANDIVGLMRVARALPRQPFAEIERIYPGTQIGGGASSVAAMEAAFWRLPVVAEVKNSKAT